MSNEFEKWYEMSEARIDHIRGHAYCKEDLSEAFQAGRAAEREAIVQYIDQIKPSTFDMKLMKDKLLEVIRGR